MVATMNRVRQERVYNASPPSCICRAIESTRLIKASLHVSAVTELRRPYDVVVVSKNKGILHQLKLEVYYCAALTSQSSSSLKNQQSCRHKNGSQAFGCRFVQI
jgi:hypothetical protein